MAHRTPGEPGADKVRREFQEGYAATTASMEAWRTEQAEMRRRAECYAELLGALETISRGPVTLFTAQNVARAAVAKARKGA